MIIEGSGKKTSYGLSPLQEGMLFQSLLNNKTSIDIEQIICAIGDIDVAALEFAWQQVWEANDALRVSFDWFGLDHPVQHVHADVPLPWRFIDWYGSQGNDDASFEEFLKSDRQDCFDLDRPPLMRLTLIRNRRGSFWLVWTFHHILIDGRSFPTIFRHMGDAYQACTRDQPIYLQPSRPYRDYIDWLNVQDWSESKAYWKSLLNGVQTPTPLSLSRPQPPLPEGEFDYAVLTTYLSEELTHSLRQVAELHSLTVNTLMQGAWAILLSRYSGEQDVIFGAIRTGRYTALDGQGTEEIVGLMINTLPIRVQIDPEAPFLQILKQLRAQVLALRGKIYEHLSLAEIQKLCDLKPGSRLFDSILDYESAPWADMLKGVHPIMQNWEFEHYDHVGYPLVASAYLGNQLKFSLEYSRELFDEDTVRRILGHMQVLLAEIVKDPACPAKKLQILTESERHLILDEWNRALKIAPEKTVTQLFEEQAAANPEQIAVVLEDRQVSYKELNRRANQLAYYLLSVGAQPDTHIAVCTERSVEMIVYLLAVLKAGGVYIPLDPDFPADRLAFMLEDAQIGFLLTQQKLLRQLPHPQARIICPEEVSSVLDHEDETDPRLPISLDQDAYIIYTSGSTGKPKGVEISHEAFAAHMSAIVPAYQTTSKDKVLQFSTISFDTSLEQIFEALTGGATLIVRGKALWSVDEFGQALTRYGVTVTEIPTAYLHELFLRWSERPEVVADLPLRLINVSGEQLSAQTLRLWHQLGLEGVRFVNTYGPTEATITATLFDLTHYVMPVSVQNVPIGPPLPGRTMYILNAWQEIVPVGVAGELYIGGAGVGRGYWNRPDLTEAKFVPNPFGEGKLYKTGDLARFLPDGNIEFLGRLDHQVKIRGFRIELGEIEAVLKGHPAVQEVVTVAREEANGLLRLVAYVVMKAALHASEADLTAELRSYLKKKLPDYMIPGAFVMLAQLPLTPNGKIDRRALPDPEFSRDVDEQFAAPRTPLEIELAKIWSGILEIDNLGVNDNFFDLGGHSLLATRLFIRIRDAIGIELPLQIIFEEPTIAELAKRIDTLTWAADQAMQIMGGLEANQEEIIL